MASSTTSLTNADPSGAEIGRRRDPRTFWRVAVALALPIGPLLVTIARAFMPYWTSDDAVTIATKITAAPETMARMQWIGLVILPFMLATVLALGYVARRGAPVLAAVGAISSFFAYGMWNASGSSDHLAWVMSTNGYSVEEMVRLNNLLGETTVAVVAGLFWVFIHIIGMVIAAIALHRARVLPLWAAMLLALSQPVHLISAVIVPSRLLDVAGGWGLTTLMCAYVAVQVLRTRNEDWDLPVTTRR